MLAGELANNPSRFVKIGDHVMWDIEQEQLSMDGTHVTLATKDHRLLRLLIQLKGKPVVYEKIINTVWENAVDRDISIESVKQQVSQLRKKVPGIDISSIYGEGYVLK